METCPNCFGHGEIDGPRGLAPITWNSKRCPTCEGSGEVPEHIARSAICADCGGWGAIASVVAQFICPGCNGLGVVLRPGQSER